MNRRQPLLSTGILGSITTAGCLGTPGCDESSNHPYLENYASETQSIDVRVLGRSEQPLGDRQWDSVLSETIEVPGQRRVTMERLYGTVGTYRTAAEHRRRFEEDRTDIGRCDDRVITIGITESVLSILTGRPDGLLPEENTT